MLRDHISPSMAQSIEDAILFGNIKEIDGVLDLISEDPSFPKDIRYCLEALRYFRAHYGRGGVNEPTDEVEKQKIFLTETAWGAEVIEKLRRQADQDATISDYRA